MVFCCNHHGQHEEVVQINVYGATLNGMLNKGINIPHILRAFGYDNSIVFDVPRRDNRQNTRISSSLDESLLNQMTHGLLSPRREVKMESSFVTAGRPRPSLPHRELSGNMLLNCSLSTIASCNSSVLGDEQEHDVQATILDEEDEFMQEQVEPEPKGFFQRTAAPKAIKRFVEMSDSRLYTDDISFSSSVADCVLALLDDVCGEADSTLVKQKSPVNGRGNGEQRMEEGGENKEKKDVMVQEMGEMEGENVVEEQDVLNPVLNSEEHQPLGTISTLQRHLSAPLDAISFIEPKNGANEPLNRSSDSRTRRGDQLLNHTPEQSVDLDEMVDQERNPLSFDDPDEFFDCSQGGHEDEHHNDVPKNDIVENYDSGPDDFGGYEAYDSFLELDPVSNDVMVPATGNKADLSTKSTGEDGREDQDDAQKKRKVECCASGVLSGKGEIHISFFKPDRNDVIVSIPKKKARLSKTAGGDRGKDQNREKKEKMKEHEANSAASGEDETFESALSPDIKDDDLSPVPRKTPRVSLKDIEGKTFSCRSMNCDKMITWKQTYGRNRFQDHVRLHYSRPTLKCSYCDYRAGYESKMRYHNKKLHPTLQFAKPTDVATAADREAINELWDICFPGLRRMRVLATSRDDF